ncbi:hypothetical protein HHI36_008968 [Cryptolaemus montrouzieri]|uniref:GAF domain-containing protein n=1 Tax=Cryptolaemus montrouzieri TaxID=559131 RepID=A0ABD2MTX1_9CUCU
MSTSTSVAEDDLDSIGAFLEANFGLVERWLKNHASAELRQKVDQALQNSPKNSTMTPDLFQLWLAASPSRTGDISSQNVRPNKDFDSMEESELFMELIRDVANELDIDVLCHKILKNVSILTHADRGSLFLTRGVGSDKYLIAKLFDVRHDTTLEEAIKMARAEEIRIPFGVGIAGSVAQSKTLINIKDAYTKSWILVNHNCFNSKPRKYQTKSFKLSQQTSL